MRALSGFSCLLFLQLHIRILVLRRNRCLHHLLVDLSLSLSVMFTFTALPFLRSFIPLLFLAMLLLCTAIFFWESSRARLFTFLLLVLLSVFMLLLFVLVRRCRLLALAFLLDQDGLEV